MPSFIKSGKVCILTVRRYDTSSLRGGHYGASSGSGLWAGTLRGGISSIFDPLGFVAPLLLDGKSILQELCHLDLSWDDLIPDDIKIKWEQGVH